MTTKPRRFALLAASALSGALCLGASAAVAQDSVIFTGTIAENYGQDGFVVSFGDTEVAVATGDLYDDNPSLRLSAGDTVTVYAASSASLIEDSIVDADGLMVDGRLVRVRDSGLDPSAYAATNESPRNMREALAERSRARSEDADRDAAEGNRRDTRMAADRRADRDGPSEAEDFDEFETFDRNGDGVVTLDEYVRVASKPANITRSEATRLFEALARGDRLMTRREYLDPPSRYERLSERFLASE